MKVYEMAGDAASLGQLQDITDTGLKEVGYADDPAWSKRTQEVLSIKLKYLSPGFRWAGSNALQIQCDSGLMADGLVRRGCDVTAVDTRAQMIDFAQKRSTSCGYRVQYRQASDGGALPFQDSLFDLVLCDHVFERGGDVATTLQEAARVLRPGGVLLFSTVNATLRTRLFATLAPVLLMPGMPKRLRGLRPIRPTRLKNELTKAGFRLNRTTGLRLRPFSIFGRPTYRLAPSRSTIYIGLAERL